MAIEKMKILVRKVKEEMMASGGIGLGWVCCVGGWQRFERGNSTRK
jgi:hypothetical protein